MSKTRPKKSLYDAYRFDGFTPVRELKGVFGEPGARVLRFNRRSKKQFAELAEPVTGAGTTKEPERRAIYLVAISGFTLSSMSGESIAESAMP